MERLADNIVLFIIGMIVMPTILYYTNPDTTKFLYISFTIILVLDSVNAAFTLE